jgi:hypothetical protein
MRLFNKKAQSTAEYAIVIAIVIGAAIAMQIYVRRGLAGGLKYATDRLKANISDKGQYEPYYLEADTTTTRSITCSTETFTAGGVVTRSTSGEKTERAIQQKSTNVGGKD